MKTCKEKLKLVLLLSVPIMFVAKDENHFSTSSRNLSLAAAKIQGHTLLMHLENHQFLTGNQSKFAGGANTSPSAVLFGRSSEFWAKFDQLDTLP